MVNNKNILLEIWDYLRIKKKWWLLPIILLLIFVGVLIILGGHSLISPFIYATG